MRVDEVKIVSVIRVTGCEGEGIDGDPCRTVYAYWTPEGKHIAIDDAWAKEQTRAEGAKEKP